jgi:aspartate aminotransferase
VACDEASGFKLGPAALEAAITPRTKWLVLNSPNNPTGAIYSAAELQALAAVLMRHPHVGVMTDEIYEHFAYGGARHASIVAIEPRLQQRALVVNGVSKAYAMTGWRIGYGACPAPLAKAITLLLTQSISSLPGMGQLAAAAALQGPQDCVAEAVRIFAQRRDRMVQMLGRVPGLRCSPPDGAFYVFASVAGLLGMHTAAGKVLANDLDVMLHLLDAAGVATIDGSSYGMPGYLRISFATSLEQIDLGCAAIARAVASLAPATASCKETSHA